MEARIGWLDGIKAIGRQRLEHHYVFNVISNHHVYMNHFEFYWNLS